MKEKNFLIFPKPDSKFKYLLIFILCSLIRRSVPRIIEFFFNYPDISDEKELNEINFNINKCYFDLLSNFIGDILAGIMKCINKNKNYLENSITSQGVKTKNKMKKIFYFYLPIIALIDFIAQFLLFLFSLTIPKNKLSQDEIIEDENLYFVVLIDIISRYIFSRVFLQSYFYKHHILAIIITCIGFIPLTVINIIQIIPMIEININKLIYLLLFITMTIIYSFEDVLNKICLNQLLLRPYELMFYKALFQIFPVTLLTIYSLIYKNLIEYVERNISYSRIFFRFSFIISNIFRTWSLITIIELINPNHLSVLKSSEFVVLFIFISIFDEIIENKNNDKYLYIFGSICCFISFIGSAIHNEIIIINKKELMNCTNYYKAEIKNQEINENLEEEYNSKDNKTLDSFLGESVDND